MAVERKRATFTYSDSLNGDRIRVLLIHPGAKDRPICCSLVTLRRDSEHPYIALSYTWGDTTRTHCIQVNKKDFWITANLHEALHHIRDVSHITYFWIDAICINQEDVSERNAQVQEMGMTYAQAEEVYIWLGTAPPDSRCLYDLCHAIERQDELTDREWAAVIPAIRQVLTSPWFLRLWVFQEAALARRGTMILGNQRVDMDTVLKLNMTHWSGIMEDQRVNRDIAMKLNMTHQRSILGNSDLHLDNPELDRLKQTCLSFDYLAAGRADISQGRYLDQGVLVCLCQGRLCQDPRDHVFALSGMAQHLGCRYEIVDYGLPVEEVYMRWMKNQLLTHVEWFSWSSPDPNLPSWVVNPSKQSRVSILPYGIYRAGGKGARLQLSESSFAMDNRLLRLHGFVLDLVAGCSKTYDTRTPLLLDGWLRAEKEVLTYMSQHGKYGNYNDSLEAYWRTLVANCREDSNLPKNDRSRVGKWPSSDRGAEYEVFVCRASPLGGSEKGAQYQIGEHRFNRAFRLSLATALQHRRMFLTENGYFGLGPSNTEIGDCVVVIPGLNLPLIVHKQSDNNCHSLETAPWPGIQQDGDEWHDFSDDSRQSEVRERYVLVGPAYVHGIMDGEYIETLRVAGRLEDSQLFEIE